ncbi:MAG TPA: hypothetical protein VGR46_09150 [Candidatus Limnocylindria bacterium]|jgi:hypothetical protein|nr:hypothetical protein [Candidatus Limnocylindria bacterium]
MATAAVSLYVALVGTLALDAWLEPLHGKATIGPKEVAASVGAMLPLIGRPATLPPH